MSRAGAGAHAAPDYLGRTRSPHWFPAPRYLEKDRVFNPASIFVDKLHGEEIASSGVEAFPRTDVPDNAWQSF